MFLIGFLVVWAGLTAYGIYKSAETALAAPVYDTTTTATTTTDSTTITKEKADITLEGETIIGLRDPVLIKRPSTLTTIDFDTTTYGDRAVLQLQNNTASAINLTGLSIRGKIVSQLAGQNGYVWEYSDYDAIEKEGEQFVEVSNDFIFDPTQAKQIGDFSWKELKPHKLYSVMLPGCHYEYEIGDVYHLTLSHVMNGGTMEDIDTDTEIMGVSINRNVGGTGETLLNLRVPSDAWELTIAKNSKLTGAGSSKRLNNRSNVVTVASSTWTGQADYYCDGTADDVEIQSAIDYIDLLGGGTINLTSGQFTITDTLALGRRSVLSGSGKNTILYNANSCTVVSMDSTYTDSDGSTISDLSILGNNAAGSTYYGIATGWDSVIRNVDISYTHNGILCATWFSVADSCFIHNCKTTGIHIYTGEGNKVTNCQIQNNTTYGIHVDTFGVYATLIGNRLTGNGTNLIDMGTGTINTGNAIG